MSKSFDPDTVESIKRAREERKAIVEKYDRGREDGAVIDDWEDPKFEVYHRQDRHGFIHDNRLPEVATRTAREQRALDKEMSRVEKWLVMIKEKDKWFPSKSANHKKLAERVWKGIPGRLRGEVWRILLNIDELREKNKGVYEEMKERGRNFSKEVRQIDLDVNRTYRNHNMFRERYNIKQKDLFHVLAAYSMYNTEVSYCQGMSQVAALLLMFMTTDEDAFWGLHQLMVSSTYNMHAFFISSFPKLQRFQDMHDKVLLKKLKKVQKHLISNGMESGIYSIKWFLQCYLGAIPFSLTLRVWDTFLLEGDAIVLSMAFNILKMNQKTLLKMDMDQLNEFLQKSLPSDFGFEEDTVIESLKDCLSDLKSAKLLWNDPIPESEKPHETFGAFNPADYEVENMLAHGERSAVNEEDRQFHRNTLQREQDNLMNLRHIDSQDSIDDVDEETDDASLNLSDQSLDREDDSPTVTSDKLKVATESLQTSLRHLDKSLEYLLQQADISGNLRTDRKYNKDTGVGVKQICFVEPVARPASAGPLVTRDRGQRTEKRLSVHMPGETRLTPSHGRPLSSPRPGHRSGSSSSRDLNLSSGRSSAARSPHPQQQQQQQQQSPRSLPSQQSVSRPDSRTSYYYGEAPATRTRPRSRYFFGDSPDLQEILHNLGNLDTTSDVAVFEDVKTPVNEAPAWPQHGAEDARLLTTEHNMRLLASARAVPPGDTLRPANLRPREGEQSHGKSYEKSHEKSHEKSRIPVNCDKHKTFSVVNRSVDTSRVRSTQEHQHQQPRPGSSGQHRTTRELYVAEYRQQPSRHHVKTQVQVHQHSHPRRGSPGYTRHHDPYFYNARDEDLLHHRHHHHQPRHPPRDPAQHRRPHPRDRELVEAEQRRSSSTPRDQSRRQRSHRTDF